MSDKITIIISTNRADSASGKVARQYREMLKDKGLSVQVLDLCELPESFMFSELYGNRTTDFEEVITSNIIDVNKFVFVIPEYNGGFPGALKVLIDAVPPAEWAGKKAALVGVSAGRAGAARAMDQFTNILNYLKVSVFYAKPKLSGIGGLMEGDVITDESSLKILATQIEGFTSF